LVRETEKKGIKASTYLGLNDGTKEISEYIENTDVDLVVMGSKGPKGGKR